MPASDQTMYPMKLLHRLFALASLALLATTVWLLAKDHQRPWKQYQRTANRLEGRVAGWRKLQYETGEAERRRRQIESQLEEARRQELDRDRLSQFRTQVARDAQRRGVPEDLTGFDRACDQLESSRRDKSGQAGDSSGLPSTLRAAVLAQMRRLIDDARRRENVRADAQRLRTADWDVAKAEVGLAVRSGLSAAEIEQRQAAADKLQAEVAELARQHAAAKDHRLALDTIFADLTARERELAKQLADNRADVARLEGTVAERKSAYFNLEHGFPLPGKKFLELPILDAFNSPLRIENLWAEGLTQDFNFRQVPRFDRCTTCHTAVQKTEPGSANTPAYPREQILQFTLSVAALQSDSSSPLEELLGLRLAEEGLLQANDVTVSCVRPGTPAAQATLATEPSVAQSADQILLDLFRTGDDAPVPRVEPGLKMGDVIVAINGQDVASRQQAIAQLVTSVKSAAGERAPSAESAAARSGEDEEEPESGDRESDGAGSTPASLVLTIRRGLPHPFSSHPRLDLFVGDLSPHKMSEFACTVCHEGQGSATDFEWASHSPNDLADRQRWRRQYGWFDNAFWDYPMYPRRFIESTCLKCHHRVADLRPSDRFPEPPAPKLLRGASLIRTYGCYGCHEINGYQDGRSIGPDLRTEPPDAAAGRGLAHSLPGQLRQPGPSLRYVGRKLQDAFLHDWLSDPQRFRPATRMPRVFGLWNHLQGGSRQLAEKYAPLEIRGIVAYLRDRTQDPAPAAAPDGISDTAAAQKAERGRVLFQTRGCLACHSHAAFADAETFRAPDEILAGPDLSDMADKLTSVLSGSPPVVRESPDPAPPVVRGSPDPAPAVVRGSPDPAPKVTDRSPSSGRPAVGPSGEVRRPAPSSEVGRPAVGPSGEVRRPAPNGNAAPSAGRAWLVDFIRQPTRLLPRTIMPNLLLEPIQNRDAAGQVLSVTDPAEDIAEFLLQHATTGYEAQVLPPIDRPVLDQLTLAYLRGTFHESRAQQYVQQGIPPQLGNTLQEAEKELIAAEEGGENDRRRTGSESRAGLSVPQQLRYVGSKSIAKYGCFGCHDIPGFETAKQIGPTLTGWGRKDTSLLAFENINAYPQSHTSPDDPATVDYFRQQLAAGSRIGFIFQKLTEPRSYDFGVAQNKPYHDRLRMPQFPFDAGEREAIITFVLGLVAPPAAEKYIYTPAPARAAISEGQVLLDKYRCTTCHLLEPQKWQLEYAPGAFRPQPDKAVFPFVDHAFRDNELQQSQQSDDRGLLRAALAGMPTLGGDGRPLVFDEEGDDLFEDEKYLPATLEYPFQLWQPAALEGRGYQVGRTAVNVRGEQIVARQRARGGSLTQYLLPHVAKLEKSANPNAEGSQAWGWLPPPLLGEGAKVRPEWLYDYLLAPYVIRPASFMRMPKYDLSTTEARALADYFAALDGAAYPYQTNDRRDRAYLQELEQAYREQQKTPPSADRAADANRLTAAMRIVTDKNYCVTCHIIGDFEPRTSDRAKGPNLADVYKRFRPDYVRRWVAEPGSVLPYTGMPIIIPYQPDAPHLGGVDKSLYPGTSLQQLDALVDLLMNFDTYTRQRAPVAPLIEAAAAPPSAETGKPAPKEPTVP